MRRLAVREGWATVILTAFIVFLAVLSIQRADWAEGLSVLNLVMVAGLIAGFVVSKWRVVPSAALHLGGFVVGVLSVVYAMTRYLNDNIGGTRDKLSWLWDRGEIWIQQIIHGESAEDLYLFVMFITILTFVMAYMTMWFVFRARWIWAALFFPGIVLLLNLGYSLRVPTSLLVFFMFAALLLLMRFTLLQREINWRRVRIDYPSTLVWRGFWVAGYLSIVVIIFGWAMPVDARSGTVNNVWENVNGPWRTVENQFNDWFVGLNGPGDSKIGGFAAFDDSFDLGGPLRLSEDPVVVVSGSNRPTYLQAHTYDLYTGRGWQSSTLNLDPSDPAAVPPPQFELSPGESRPLDPTYNTKRERQSFDLKLETPRGTLLFSPGAFVSADVGTNLVVSWRDVDEVVNVQDVTAEAVPDEVWPLIQMLQAVDLTPPAPPIEPTLTPDPVSTPAIAATATPKPAPDLSLIPGEVRQLQLQLSERNIFTSFTVDQDSYKVATLNYSGQFPVLQDVEAVHASGGVADGQEYSIEAMVSQATGDDLRATGQDYPQEVVDRYLELPDTVTQRTKVLAQDIASEARSDDPYDVAKALETYLRQNIEYNENIEFPPANVDVVDWVLFTTQQGYCEYYASSFIVMARSLGLPTRMSVGFFPTQDRDDDGGYIYRELNAHAWPEVFFPGYGWIGFEPTAARDAVNRDPSATGGGPSDRGDQPLLGGEGRNDTQFPSLNDPFLEENQNLPTGAGAIQGSQDNSISTSDVLVRVVPLSILLVILVGVYLWLRGTRGLTPANQMYTKLSRGATWSGVRTEASMTPHEYAASVSRRISGSRQPVTVLTDLYVRENFSPHKAAQSDVLRARQAWLRLRGVLLRHFVSKLAFWRSQDSSEYEDEDW